MPIPTEPVGSLPRPSYLQQAFKDYDAGKITRIELISMQDRAVEDSIKLMEATGQDLITDGEQRVSSFATYAITDTLGGKGLIPNMEGDGLILAKFSDGHCRQLPRLTLDFSGPFKYKTYSYKNLAFSKPYASKPMKVAVVSPSLLYLTYGSIQFGDLENYPRSVFVDNIISECVKDIRGCFEAGAKRVSIDFTEGRLALHNHPDLPWTGTGLLQTFIDLNNQVLAHFSAAERVNIGIHTCPGGDHDSTHSADVPYHYLLPSLFKINAGYFLLQFSSEEASSKSHILKEIGCTIRRDAEGVKQIAFIGVTNPIHPRVESAEEIRDALLEAAKWIPKDQLGATDDCGFSPFSDDTKPKFGGADLARKVAFEKMKNRVDGARMASDILGI